MGKIKDITGQTFNHLTAVRKIKGQIWEFLCVCGETKTAYRQDVRSGKTVSCGCRRIKHGHIVGNKPSRTYRSWQNMVARCTLPSNPAFEHYKKRGITLCDRWRDFENFLADMGDRPEGNYTLDRIDNDGNYEPGNCRWATKREQANNRFTNIHFTYLGKDYTLAELARKTGVSKELLRGRLVKPHKRKWTVEEAVALPPMKKNGEPR